MAYTTYVPQIGDIVRKGNGQTLYRIVSIKPMYGTMRAAVVKATTVNVPRSLSYYPFDLFMLVNRSN